jgi:tetratricopeptide (TPR) repeat protein
MVKCISLACATLLLGTAVGLAQQASRAGANAAEVAPSDAVRRALTLEQQGNFADALAAWEMVVKAEPRNGRAYAQLGLLEARQEHYAQAIADYRKAETLNPAIPQLKLNLGLAYFKSGEFRSASRVFEAELAKHPNGADGARFTILIGMSHYGAHEYEAAIPYLKKAAAADRRNLPLRMNLAHCYLWTKQLDATLGVYKEILDIDPDSAEADMIAGEALDEKGDTDGAIHQFQAAARVNPKEPNVHFGLAYLLWTLRRYDEALPEFNAELQNDPKNYQAMLYLGDLYVRTGSYDKAREVLEKAAPYEKSDPLIYLDMGIVYQEAGDMDRAAEELKETIKLEPESVNAHFRLGQVYRSMGKKDESKAEFAKVSSLNKKTNQSVHKRIADANARPDRKTEAAPQATPDKP